MALTDIMGDALMVFRVYIAYMDLAKEMMKKGCLSFATKKSCVWQAHGLKKSSRGK